MSLEVVARKIAALYSIWPTPLMVIFSFDPSPEDEPAGVSGDLVVGSVEQNTTRAGRRLQKDRRNR